MRKFPIKIDKSKFISYFLLYLVKQKTYENKKSKWK